MSSEIQMLEELVRKYEEHRDRKYDNDLKLQRLYDILPKPFEQQLAATYESVKRGANNWIMMNSTGRADADLGTMGNGGEYEDDDGGRLVGRLEGTDRRKGKTRKGTTQWTLLPVWTVETRQRIASRRRQCVTTVDGGDMEKS